MRALDARLRELASETRILGETLYPREDVAAGYVTGAEFLGPP
jgi:hypothetical protein